MRRWGDCWQGLLGLARWWRIVRCGFFWFFDELEFVEEDFAELLGGVEVEGVSGGLVDGFA